jgi:hypothetical protein
VQEFDLVIPAGPIFLWLATIITNVLSITCAAYIRFWMKVWVAIRLQ